MYKKFYGLKRNPFEISPDPYFFFQTEQHNEALASIYYGIARRKGFVVMTGEVGTGKTLLVRYLMEVLKLQQVAFANVFCPLLSGIDFLRYVIGDLGLKADSQSKSSIVLELNTFLIARHRKGLPTVLIVDEAQNLFPEVLEEIRLLTNLETSQQKLLQILLVGQPELEEQLDAPDLQQLKQRIAVRCRLETLRENEIHTYIVLRLKLAGLTQGAELLFPPETVAVIFRCSRGIPRLINTICENSLIAAFAHQVRSVAPDIVEAVAAEFRLGRSAGPHRLALPTAENEQQAAAFRSFLQAVETMKRISTGLQKARFSPPKDIIPYRHRVIS